MATSKSAPNGGKKPSTKKMNGAESASGKSAQSKSTALVVDVKPKRDPFFSDPNSINEFCDYIAEGGHMAGFCMAKGLKYNAVNWWVISSPVRDELYARARSCRADVLFDEVVGIADESTVTTKYDGEDVVLALDATAVARNRLRVEARKWAASKLKPGSYGDKTTTELTGLNGGPMQLAAMDLKGLSAAELETMRALMAKAAGASGTGGL